MLHNHIRRGVFQFLKNQNLSHIIQKKDQSYINATQEISQHYSVMLKDVETIVKNRLKPDQYFLDCTLGCGGHSLAMVKKSEDLKVIGIDLDKRMIENIYEKLQKEDKSVQERLRPLELNFKDISSINIKEIFPEETQKNSFDYILADLGYSSWHLANPDWGFSYMEDGILDMRYNPNSGNQTAADLLNHTDALTLTQIFQEYGDFRSPKKLINIIMQHRKSQPFQTTQDLRNLILHNTELDNKFKTLVKGTVMYEVFQCLRIAVNSEMENLELLLQNIDQKLIPSGIGMIITFHSLEEKVVQQYLNMLKRKKRVKLLDKLKPSKEEIQENVRSRSAKLYVFEKL